MRAEPVVIGQAACAPRMTRPSPSRTPTDAEIGGEAGAQLEAIAGVEEHADTRRTPPGEHGKPIEVVRVEARLSGRQRDHAVGDTDADVVELVRPARGVVIVDDDDPLRDGHAAGRPGEQRPVLDEDRRG